MLKSLTVLPTSLVNHFDMQRIELKYHCSKACHLSLAVYDGDREIANEIDVAFTSGKCNTFILLPVQDETIMAKFVFTTLDGEFVYECVQEWKTPRDWTIYFMISSHTDIGLHNSQYIQRANSEKFIELAISLTEQTRNGNDDERYKYIMEGTWFWNNFPMDKGKKKAREVIEKYVKKGDLGICCGVAGNVMQAFGLEELCRFAYERKKLQKEWGVSCETMTMIDNNGMPLSIIQPLSDAGYKNIIFSPNQWNPKNSTIWERNLLDDTYPWNPNAGGTASRIDFRYESDLPMTFFWEDYNGNRLLICGSTQYDNSGAPFGIFNKPQPALINKDEDYIPYAEIKTAKTLRLLENKYDFNLWLLPCYSDDQEPNLWLRNKIVEWNKKWKYPHFAIIGNPDIPFNILREKFYDKIPIVKGDLTGGWYQLHPSIADFTTKKYQTDRLLPIAEKYNTIASILDKNFLYPKTQFDRAWNYLLFNDEHSYGASGYKGRKVHETWLQHRDWLDKSYDIATQQIESSTTLISSKIKSDNPALVAFNPTNQTFDACVKSADGTKYTVTTLPKFGYKAIDIADLKDNVVKSYNVTTPPTIENQFYKVELCENGAIKSILDKQLNKELLDLNNAYKANEIIYTRDDYLSFQTPEKASFSVINDCDGISVVIKTALSTLGAEIEQKITLLAHEKKIVIDNAILHARDMYNLADKQTYTRYLYIAFPFMIENAKRLCHLNGAVMEYAKDVTGHCTDVYNCIHDWCAVQNENVGIALLAKQSQLVEFDHIHPDKSDFGNVGKGSQIFCYVANDWLQMHVPNGEHLNFYFNYAITSYPKDLDAQSLGALAERFITPIHTAEIPAQNGTLSKERTFFDFNTNSRFIALKPAEDGDGLIARFYGEQTKNVLDSQFAQPVTVDECETCVNNRVGFFTYKLNGYKVKYKKELRPVLSNQKPLPIGSHYTGLIDKAKATNGENNGLIYLIWGRSCERNFSHYEVYRSETPNFKANKKTFVANVYPENFVIARYADQGLKNNTTYYYKVCAVNKNGVKSDFSPEFSAQTKQPL